VIKALEVTGDEGGIPPITPRVVALAGAAAVAGGGVPKVKFTVETTGVAFPAIIVGSNFQAFAVCSALA
jgi:hypothetical protein